MIFSSLFYLDEQNCQIEIRIPYVPEWNSGEIEQMTKLLSKMKNITKIRVLPYHNYAGSKYDALGVENTLPTSLPSEEEMKTVRERIKKIIGKQNLMIE